MDEVTNEIGQIVKTHSVFESANRCRASAPLAKAKCRQAMRLSYNFSRTWPLDSATGRRSVWNNYRSDVINGILKCV